MAQKLSELFNPHPRQRAFLDAIARHKFILYGGAGGGGKSYLLRWSLVCLLLEWAAKRNLRNVRVGLFSEDYPTLTDRQISKIAREMPPWLGRLKRTKEDGLGFFLHERFGGGAIRLRNLADPESYKSAEFAAIAVEELTMNPEQTFHDLRFRLRWPGIEDTKFLAATNPGGIGHAWVKRYWITGDFPPEMRDIAPLFAYVPAKARDNPHNAESYHRELDSLPPDMRAAVRDGSWDVFVGQKFGEFRREIHVVPAFKIPTWWERWGSNDPGYTDPGVWHTYAADQVGNVYITREFTFNRTAYSKQAEHVAKVLAAAKEHMGYWVTGMDAFVPHPETRKTYVDYYAQGGLLGFRQPVHGSGSRRLRAGSMHEYLLPFPHPEKPDQMTARLHIFAPAPGHVGCPKLIETLPSLVGDELDAEAVAESAIDHWYDSATYGLTSRHAVAEQPKTEEYAEGTMGEVLNHAEAFEQEDGEATPFRNYR